MQTSFTPDQLKALRHLLRMRLLARSIRVVKAAFAPGNELDFGALITEFIAVHDDIDLLDIPLRIAMNVPRETYSFALDAQTIKEVRSLLDDSFSEIAISPALKEVMDFIDPQREGLKLALTEHSKNLCTLQFSMESPGVKQ